MCRRPRVCVCVCVVSGGRCGCVCVCFPRAPSSFATAAAFHRINIALHNPASVSARLDPLPQPRDRLVLYASNPRVQRSCLCLSLFLSRFARVSLARVNVDVSIGGVCPLMDRSENGSFEPRDQDRPVCFDRQQRD